MFILWRFIWSQVHCYIYSRILEGDKQAVHEVNLYLVEV